MGSLTGLATLVAGLDGLSRSGPPRLLAVGWATVDLERTVADLARPGPTGTVVDEPLLGARAVRVALGPTDVLVLEPAAEGRLAAALTRRGEGICALYLAAHEPSGRPMRPTALGLPGRLLHHDQPWGPFVIEVADA